MIYLVEDEIFFCSLISSEGLVAFVRANAVVNMSSVGDFYGGSALLCIMYCLLDRFQTVFQKGVHSLSSCPAGALIAGS